jgi:CheY-like chemotaxis protein
MNTPNPSQSAVQILVVDDHPHTATTLARALSQIGPGIEVIYATNGFDALEKVKSKKIDILFTDMVMPEMTGLELIEKMQKLPNGHPPYIFLLTAYEVPGLSMTARRMKVNEIITKPVHPERICQIASRAIEEIHSATRPMRILETTHKKFKILIADDQPDNVILMERYLEFEGYDHITAADGLETLQKVRSELPDLVLLDVNMPNKDGFQVLGEVRNDPAVAHIPIIILTAARQGATDMRLGLNMGADDYVTKPFDRHELIARIRTKLRVKQMEDTIRRRNQELNLLPEIGKELSARTNIDELLGILLRRSVETLGAISGHILVINPDARPLEKSYTKADVKIDFPDLGGFFDEINETHTGILIRDTQADHRWSKGQVNLFLSAVIVPLFGRNALLGVLVLTHENAGYFEEEHISLLQAIAGQAAIAIENARLFGKLEAIHRELTQNTLREIASPLSAIKTTCELLQASDSLTDIHKNHVKGILSATSNIDQQIVKLLEVGKQTAILGSPPGTR